MEVSDEHEWTNMWAKSLTTGLLLLTALTISSTSFAFEPTRDPGRIDLRRPDLLLVQITWQIRAPIKSSRNRFHAVYIGGLETRYGGHAEVSRSNLLNSPAARYFTRILTGRHGR